MAETLTGKILFVAACLLLPVVWGVVVNWLFNLWNGRKVREAEDDDDWVFPDYQI